MFKVELGSDDFYKDSEYVEIGKVTTAIEKILLLNGSLNRFQAESDAWPFIHTGIVAEKLHPLAPETLDALSTDNSGNGIVLFSELIEWGLWCHRFDFVDGRAQAERQSEFNFGYYGAIARDAGNPPDWSFWAGLKSLTPIKVSCLLVELDPDKYANIKTINRFHELVRYIDRLAYHAETDSEGRKLSPEKWIEWAQGKGYVVPHKFIEAVAEVISKAQKGTPDARKEEFIPIQKQQENAILNWLRKIGYDPLKLPVPPSGKSGIKKLCREAVQFSSPSVFNTAWDRLRANGEIKDAR